MTDSQENVLQQDNNQEDNKAAQADTPIYNGSHDYAAKHALTSAETWIDRIHVAHHQEKSSKELSNHWCPRLFKEPCAKDTGENAFADVDQDNEDRTEATYRAVVVCQSGVPAAVIADVFVEDVFGYDDWTIDATE